MTLLWGGSALVAVLCTSAFDGPPLIINTTTGPPLSTSAHDGFQDLVVIEMFRRAGRHVELVALPGERSLMNANSGLDDGVAMRVAGLEKVYPSLVRVPEPLMFWEFMAFARNPDVRVPDRASFCMYDVGIVTGWKIIEQMSATAQSVTSVRDVKVLFGLLELDRVDLVIFERWQGEALLNSRTSRVLEPPLISKPMYVYVHRKHVALVAALTRSLRQMKTDGSYARLRAQTIGAGNKGVVNAAK